MKTKVIEAIRRFFKYILIRVYNDDSILAHILRSDNHYFTHLLNTTAENNIFHNTNCISNSTLAESVKLWPYYKISNSHIGRYTYIAQNSIINNTTIGGFCSIGPNFMCGWGIHPTSAISTAPMFYSTRKQNGMTLSVTDKIEEVKNITIGNDVFIGMNVTVLDGVSIGDGAVIGAGCVVSKDIPAYAIAVGNPVKIIRYRFSDDIIEKMLDIKWWEWNIERLKDVEVKFFNVEELIDMYYNKKKE